jgi:hypothetical protein
MVLAIVFPFQCLKTRISHAEFGKAPYRGPGMVHGKTAPSAPARWGAVENPASMGLISLMATA